MRSVLITAGLLVVFAAVLAIGAPTTATAQELNAVGAIDWQVDGSQMIATEQDEAVVLESEVDGEGKRRAPGRQRQQLKRLAMAVHKACPCEGPEEGVAWKNHGEFVACVTDKVNELKDKGLPEEVAARIVKRAARSEIGKPGHVCPVPPERPEPGEPREPGKRGERP